VTENRPAFIPWLLRGYDAQTHRRRELVVVDSSPVDLAFPRRPDVRVVRVAPGTSVAVKRNLAIHESRGEMVAWFDDDDWQHVERLSRLVALLEVTGTAYAGPSCGWFLDLATLGCERYESRNHVVFNGALFWREVATSVEFEPSLRRGSDTRWLRELRNKHGNAFQSVDATLFYWLCHGRNLSNPRGKRRCKRPLADLRAAIDGGAWGDTTEALHRLRRALRLEKASPADKTEYVVALRNARRAKLSRIFGRERGRG
jgi:glycosyltransferase involved in cell wall biosynthesis